MAKSISLTRLALTAAVLCALLSSPFLGGSFTQRPMVAAAHELSYAQLAAIIAGAGGVDPSVVGLPSSAGGSSASDPSDSSSRSLVLSAEALGLASFAVTRSSSDLAVPLSLPSITGAEDEAIALASSSHSGYEGANALGFPMVAPAALQQMSARELRRFIAERGGRCDGCVERRHLLEMAMLLRSAPSEAESVVAMLTPFSTSAPTMLTTDILRPQSAAEVEASLRSGLSAAVLRDPSYYCELVEKQDENAPPPAGTPEASSHHHQRQQQQQQQPPEISCRPRTADDAPL